MTEPIPKLDIKKKTGREPFCSGGVPRDFDVLDYWRWATSDLVSNASRGILAEYIVARAVGVSTTSVRDEWAAYDLETPDGIKLEVKSAAYIQSWWQRDFSPISFKIKKTRSWNDETGYSGEPTRKADLYVFALLAHKDHRTIDPLELDQWTFYVLPHRATGGAQGKPSLHIAVCIDRADDASTLRRTQRCRVYSSCVMWPLESQLVGLRLRLIHTADFMETSAPFSRSGRLGHRCG